MLVALNQIHLVITGIQTMQSQSLRPNSHLFLDADCAHIDQAALILETRRLRARSFADTWHALQRLVRGRGVRHFLTHQKHT